MEVRLDTPLPAELLTGGPTAVFVAGTCAVAGERPRALRLAVDGAEQPLLAHGMPRLDLLRIAHPEHDPYALRDPGRYRSGFWGLARVPAGAAGVPVELGLCVVGADCVALGRIPRVAPPAPVALPPGASPSVAICMAAHEPPEGLLRRQVDSLRAQTHGDWVCVISDDCSSPAGAAVIRAVVGDDPRFVLSRSPRRLGFYRNFERALALVPPGVRHVALADQDDVWHPDKLATLLDALGDARLVYSDARVIAPDGTVLAGSYWTRRRPNHTDLLSELVANAVTGAASLFPRALLDDALPFPPAQFGHYHDHWLALCALATGDIAFVDRPLYDYVQHGRATLGHAAATRMPSLRERARGLRRDPRERVRAWRLHYFADACRLLQLAAVLEARAGDRMAPAKRRALGVVVRAERSPRAIARLAGRGARELTVARPETLGAEWMLAHAFAWRRLLDATVRDRPVQGLRLDAVPPPQLDPRPGARASAEATVRPIAEKIAPLRVAVRDDAPPRVNLLIPTFDLRHFFGGYIAKLNLARRLAARGARVRVVTVDPVGPLPASWRADVEAYAGLQGLFAEVEVAFGRESGLEVSRDDAFVATTWWTAHVAGAALAAVDADVFAYLIQEQESLTFPMGSLAALADAAHRLPHAALFSTELLRDSFRARGLGVYAGGIAAGDRRSAAFENAITAVAPPAPGELVERDPRRLLVYARPEAHAARNMFELAVLALGRALDCGAFAGWALHGIGTVGGARTVDLGGGAALAVQPRTSQAAYAEVLRAHDVGLALMYTPHPSLVPIEMAAAGMLAVTNTYENKTAEALAAISGNLVAAEPTVDGIADALGAASAAAGDADRRVAGGQVRWARTWEDAFPDALVDRLLAQLGR